MCLTCGCDDAHKPMGDANITYEDVKRAATANGRSVDEVLDSLAQTAEHDRHEHEAEYSSSSHG